MMKLETGRFLNEDFIIFLSQFGKSESTLILYFRPFKDWKVEFSNTKNVLGDRFIILPWGRINYYKWDR